MEITIPAEIENCIKTLNNAGYEAYCVGGAVRDLYMGKNPSDYDITTNAAPEHIMSIFPHTVPTGIKHGTVTVITDNYSVEITTYRADGDYKEHRHPETVNFVSDIKSDLIRRDFTVNAICYSPEKGIFDPINGTKDIDDRIIRAVGDPEKRFTEDALRILRAFRFSAQLGFRIEENTYNAALKCAGLLKYISPERIFSEIKKTVTSPFPASLSPLIDTKALAFCKIDDLLLDGTEKAESCFSLRFAIACRSAEKAKEILRFLHSDNNTVNDTVLFTELLNETVTNDRYILKKLLRKYGYEKLSVYLEYKNNCGFKNADISETLNDIIKNNEPYLTPMLALDGSDLLNLGISGPDIGKTLDYLLDKVMHRPELNEKDILIKLIKQM